MGCLFNICEDGKSSSKMKKTHEIFWSTSEEFKILRVDMTVYIVCHNKEIYSLYLRWTKNMSLDMLKMHKYNLSLMT